MSNETGVFSHIKRGFPVSAVWFGALVGPSLLSGGYAVVYLCPYGAWGVILPLLMEIPIVIMAAMSATIVAKNKTYDYYSLGKVVYGKLYKIMMPFLDYYIIVAFITGGAAVANIEGSIGAQAFGCSEILGATIFGIITVFIITCGPKLMRAFSAISMPIMTVGFIVLGVIIINHAGDSLGNILADEWVPFEGHNLGVGIWNILVLGMSNLATTFGSMCAIEQKIRNGKDAAGIAICSFIMNSFLFIMLALMILPYCPEALDQAQPTVWLINTALADDFPWLVTFYMYFMFLVLLTSDAPQCNAIVARIMERMAKSTKRKKKFDPNNRKQRLIAIWVIGMIYEGICITVAQVGLINIFSIGYSICGYLGIVCCAVPTVIYFFRYMVGKNRKPIPIVEGINDHLAEESKARTEELKAAGKLAE